MPGEVWEEHENAEVKRQCDEYGFHIDVVESVSVHDDIKIGLPTRDMYIESYKQTIRNLSKYGVKVICYNFMPIFDWTRSNLFHEVGTPTARTGKLLAATPMKKFGEISDLIGTLMWLADDNASGFVTGTVIPVDGGFSAYSGV